jgi:hypothetical protein
MTLDPRFVYSIEPDNGWIMARCRACHRADTLQGADLTSGPLIDAAIAQLAAQHVCRGEAE